MKHQSLLASLLCITLLASCSGCGKKNETDSESSSSSEAVQIQESDAANSIQIEGTEGDVNVTDDQGKDHTPEKDMNLYVDYSVETEEESLAWMEADATKLYAMGPSSEVAVEETGRNMKMRVNEGTFFFAYTEPLNEDESAEFYTNLTSMSIRGTCGIIQAISDTETEIQILEGNVKVKTLDEQGNTVESKSVTTGLQIVVQKDESGAVTSKVEHIDLNEIPEYVYDAIKKNDDVKSLIEEKAGNQYLKYVKEISETESSVEDSQSSSESEEVSENSEVNTTDNSSTSAILTDAKDKYYALLTETYSNGNYNNESHFAFFYLTSDNIPELAMIQNMNGSDQLLIYTYENGNIIKCENGNYGSYRAKIVYVEKGNLIHSNSDGRQGITTEEYSTLDENHTIAEIATVHNSFQKGTNSHFLINQTDVDGESFISYMNSHFPGARMSIVDGYCSDDTVWTTLNLSEGYTFTPDEINTALTEAFETNNIKNLEETEAIIRDYGFGDIWTDKDTGEGYSDLMFQIDASSIEDQGDYYIVKTAIYKPISVSGEMKDSYSFITKDGTELNLVYAKTENGEICYDLSRVNSEDFYFYFSEDHLIKGETILFYGSGEPVLENLCKGTLKISKDCQAGSWINSHFFPLTYDYLTGTETYYDPYGIIMNDDGVITSLCYMGH